MLTNLVGKTVTIYVDKDYVLSGKLSNHKPNLYQVTCSSQHIVFWDKEIVGIVNNDLIHQNYIREQK